MKPHVPKRSPSPTAAKPSALLQLWHKQAMSSSWQEKDTNLIKKSKV